jgi:hypothetical protein
LEIVVRNPSKNAERENGYTVLELRGKVSVRHNAGIMGEHRDTVEEVGSRAEGMRHRRPSKRPQKIIVK